MSGEMDKRGMTFTEIIVAMLILSLVVAGSFAAFTSGAGFTMRSRRRAIAANFARQTIEELRNAVLASTWPNSGPLAGGNHPPPVGGALSGLPPGATRFYDVTDVDVDNDLIIDYKRVTVTVHWDEP